MSINDGASHLQFYPSEFVSSVFNLSHFIINLKDILSKFCNANDIADMNSSCGIPGHSQMSVFKIRRLRQSCYSARNIPNLFPILAFGTEFFAS